MEPLQLFLEQLDTDSAETRVDAMRRCFVVANAIGRDATLHKLIPFLNDHIRARADLSAEISDAAAVPTGTEEDDEILLILAEQLGQMVVCGLIPGHRALSVLPILEQLAGVEETVVRDKAVESLNGIMPLLFVEKKSVEGKEEEEARLHCVRSAPGLLLAMIKRMASADWFTSKISACSVLPCVYQFFNCLEPTTVVKLPTSAMGFEDGAGVTAEETKAELRTMYRTLSEDDTPMVRRGAGKNLARYAEAVANLPYGKKGSTSGPVAHELFIPHGRDEGIIKKTVTQGLKKKVFDEVVTIYQALSTDEQDSVRLLAVSSSGSVGCALGMDADMCREVVLPVIKAGAEDVSWRVRHSLAKEFAIVAQSQGFHESARRAEFNAVFESFALLLQDFEAQVRASAVENIARMAQLGGVDIFKVHIAPLLPRLADDPVMEVRSKLAQTIMDCCDYSICTTLPDEVILQDFEPCLECLLNDEFAEVQLHILPKLSRVTHLLNQMDVVVQSIVAMSEAQNWRVRQAVGFLLPHLAEARGVGFFEVELLRVWMVLLMDQVADVRSSCVGGMPKLLSVTGSAWMQKEIMKRYVDIYDKSISYLSRITVLRSFSRLASGKEGLSTELAEEIATQLLRGLSDKVVNVRLVAARGLNEMGSTLDEGFLNARVLPALQQIVDDDDEDVDCKYFSMAAKSTLAP